MASVPGIVDVKVGGQVRAMREARGFDDEEVANYLGVSVEEYRNLERGLKRFSASQLRDLSSLMKVNVAAFFNTLAFGAPVGTRGEGNLSDAS